MCPQVFATPVPSKLDTLALPKDYRIPRSQRRNKRIWPKYNSGFNPTPVDCTVMMFALWPQYLPILGSSKEHLTLTPILVSGGLDMSLVLSPLARRHLMTPVLRNCGGTSCCGPWGLWSWLDPSGPSRVCTFASIRTRRVVAVAGRHW